MSIPKAAEPQFIPLNPSSPTPPPDDEEVEFLLQQFLGKIISKDFKEALELAQNGIPEKTYRALSLCRIEIGS